MSRDNGTTWTIPDDILGRDLAWQNEDVSINSNANGTCWAISAGYGQDPGVWTSTDPLGTWIPVDYPFVYG